MIISQKCDREGFQFSFSLDESSTLYECNYMATPPWQLGTLRKPSRPSSDLPSGKSKTSSFTSQLNEKIDAPNLPLKSYPILDKFVAELKNNPMLIAQYVYNEIAFVDPLLTQQNGVFLAPAIQRNPCTTFLEKQGSPWEQCRLLVYLLKEAGYQAVFAHGDPCSVPKAFAEKLLFTQQPGDEDYLLDYPWVLFFDGNDWISLFPWMKEIQIDEGHHLYNLMPEEYASGELWIDKYLRNDPNIMKHKGPDGDDTAGVLFVRFVEEQLRQQGLSIHDVGIHRRQQKKHFSSWEDFHRPTIIGETQILESLAGMNHLYSYVKVEIFSQQNPDKKVWPIFHVSQLDSSNLSLRFVPNEVSGHTLRIGIFDEEVGLDLNENDTSIAAKVTYCSPCLENDNQFTRLGISSKNLTIDTDGHRHEHMVEFLSPYTDEHTFSIPKGTAAALCFHTGNANKNVLSQYYEKFANETDEDKKLNAILAYMGASFFEKCSRADKAIANLHKLNSRVIFACGMSKLSPDVSKGSVVGFPDLKYPQVDMTWFTLPLTPIPHPIQWHQETYLATLQYLSLITVDLSSNEHQILREIFNDHYPISTVKLLQLAHDGHQMKNLPNAGFLHLAPATFTAIDKSPELAHFQYFPQLKDFNINQVVHGSPEHWAAIKDEFSNPFLTNFIYAYMTPGAILNQDGSLRTMGTLILGPNVLSALISNKNLISNGGFGSSLINSPLYAKSSSEWSLVPSYNGYSLAIRPFTSLTPTQEPSHPLIQPPPPPPALGFNFSSSYYVPSALEGTMLKADARLDFKSIWNTVADPVDAVTGAFYVDEIDLALPGSFPLNIRRNYNSQNPIPSIFGCGWKLSLNPFLVEQDGKLYAAEEDGTVIVYRLNANSTRYIVDAEDNPDLCNGRGNASNPFQAYIENNILYSSDGSKRTFEDGLLKTWVNATGTSLTFLYDQKCLSRIESSTGAYCGFKYSPEGMIREIYSQDGRRINYTYDSQGDLRTVTLPNEANVTYEYDSQHQIIRETKPYGRVLENIYKDGKVIQQISPMGQNQAMTTTATFEYQEGLSTVTDSGGGTTIYHIHEKQIYKILDPKGYKTLNAWFIDANSWFDPETEKIMPYDLPGGYARSLKSSTDKRGLITSYQYDANGNVKEITLQGEDLTGNGVTTASQKYEYNDNNLCILEEAAGHKSTITYDPNFPYLPKRSEKYCGDILLSYAELQYNAKDNLKKKIDPVQSLFGNMMITVFQYKMTQVTGTEDPDVVTIFSYNMQGQCSRISTSDAIQECDYDVMGNKYHSISHSINGTFLSESYVGYNLNNEPIWTRDANPNNLSRIDYHSSGNLKATSQILALTKKIAYTIYEYDSRGNLIHEVDPLGYCTYREYDAIGESCPKQNKDLQLPTPMKLED